MKHVYDYVHQERPPYYYNVMYGTRVWVCETETEEGAQHICDALNAYGKAFDEDEETNERKETMDSAGRG